MDRNTWAGMRNMGFLLLLSCVASPALGELFVYVLWNDLRTFKKCEREPNGQRGEYQDGEKENQEQERKITLCASSLLFIDLKHILAG